jgi:hypothetical protein
VRSGGKEKAFYVLIFIELVMSYGRKKISFVFCSLWSLVKKLKKIDNNPNVEHELDG